MACSDERLGLETPPDCLTGDSGFVLVPSRSDWTEHGTILRQGEPGEWDARIEGMFTLGAFVKLNGNYFLYYVGATGDRVFDDGPANRALGVASSTDGIHFQKHAGNPVITHQPSAPDGRNVEEEGVFSSAADVHDGTIALYFGGMEAVGATTVDGDIVLATSTDGLNFTIQKDVWTHDRSGITRGDEIFPTGAYRDPNGTWHVYFVEASGAWDLWVASGPAMDDLRTDQKIDSSGEWRGATSVNWKTEDQRIYVTSVMGTGRADAEWRETGASRPADLGPSLDVHDFDQSVHTTFLDREAGKWFQYYLTLPERDAIAVRTAPVRCAR